MVGLGAYTLQNQPRPLAHLEIQHQQASAPSPQRRLPDPDVVPEQLVEDVGVTERLTPTPTEMLEAEYDADPGSPFSCNGFY